MYTQTNGVISTIQLAPGSYRLALNPAGYPISYRSKASALHIDVVAGTTTEILVPLIPADAITGTVKNSVGEPIIVGVSKQFRSLMAIETASITNNSGLYYLKGLQQGEYRIMVSGLATNIADCTSAGNDRIRISSTANPVQELNLPQQPTPANPTSFHHVSGHHLATKLDISIN